SPGPLQFAAITASRFPHLKATVIRSSRVPLLEPAPGYFLRPMPFSENSLVEDLPSGGEGNRTSLVSGHLDDVVSRDGRKIASHTPAVGEIRRLRIGNFVN